MEGHLFTERIARGRDRLQRTIEDLDEEMDEDDTWTRSEARELSNRLDEMDELLGMMDEEEEKGESPRRSQHLNETDNPFHEPSTQSINGPLA